MTANPQALVRFVKARLSPQHYLALRVGAGALLMIVASWIFGEIAFDVVTGDTLVTTDAEVAMWLHRHANGTLTRAMLVLTNVHGVAGIAALSLVTAGWLIAKKYWYWLLALALAVPGGLLLNMLLKSAYHRVRPSFDDPLLTLATYSFPSGHTAGTTLFYGFMAALLVSRVRAWRWRVATVMLAVLMIVLVGLSRMYLGVHYLSDVMAAAAISIAWLALCLTSVDELRRRQTGKRLIPRSGRKP
jgi:undecaprenyl-diphosphatase